MRTPLLAPIALVAAAVLGLVLAPARATAAQDDFDVAEAVDELSTLRDDADPALIRGLADAQTREAMEGLLSVYDRMGSIYMKREIVRALARYDTVEDAFQPALDHVMQVATESQDVELRDAALDALGRCHEHGKHFLAQIVESPAEDEVRIRAMELHVRRFEPDDVGWYRELYERTKKEDEDEAERKRRERERQKNRRGRGDEVEEEKIPIVWRLPKIRAIAMEAILRDLTDDELVEAFQEDRSSSIQLIALAELHSRGHDATEEFARSIFERVDRRGSDRARAAEILADLLGPDVGEDFIDHAEKADVTPDVLRQRMADLLVEMDDDRINRRLERMVGRGKAHEKKFALRATRHLVDDKLAGRIRRGLRDREPSVVKATLESIAFHRDKEALDDLDKMVEREDDPEVLAAVLETLSEIHDGDNDWVERIVEYTGHESIEVRNAAIYELGRLGRRNLIDLYVSKLEDPNWSTRLAALRALEALRVPGAIGPIVERMPEESGRMLHEFADALWRLTGQPFRTRHEAWSRWWSEEGGDDFEIIDPDELSRLEEEEEERRLKQISNASFFGIRIISHRVCFILDVSGSMNEPLRAEYRGVRGDSRIEVAKAELRKAIEALEPDALFNVVSFSSGVEAWLEDGVASSTSGQREEGLLYVDRLGAGGGTNIYGALELAFADPDVDTIFLLSDGEPTVGDVIDAQLIRDEVDEWNEDRGIVIHTIAVGGELQLMQWLAEDHDGRHVEYQ